MANRFQIQSLRGNVEDFCAMGETLKYLTSEFFPIQRF